MIGLVFGLVGFIVLVIVAETILFFVENILD